MKTAGLLYEALLFCYKSAPVHYICLKHIIGQTKINNFVSILSIVILKYNSRQ